MCFKILHIPTARYVQDYNISTSGDDWYYEYKFNDYKEADGFLNDSWNRFVLDDGRPLHVYINSLEYEFYLSCKYPGLDNVNEFMIVEEDGV